MKKRIKNRIERLEARPQTARRQVRIQKQKMKSGEYGEYSRKEIKTAKLTAKASILHAENLRLGQVGSQKAINKMVSGGEKYHNLVGRVRRLDPTGKISGYNMKPISKKSNTSNGNTSNGSSTLNTANYHGSISKMTARKTLKGLGLSNKQIRELNNIYKNVKN